MHTTTSYDASNHMHSATPMTLITRYTASSPKKHSTATLDNCYGLFLTMLAYKLAERGKALVKVDKWFASSQLCSNCGFKHPEMNNLRNRVMRCDCGLVLDRDQNAAINILNEGLRLLNLSNNYSSSK